MDITQFWCNGAKFLILKLFTKITQFAIYATFIDSQFFWQIEDKLSLGGKKVITPSIAGQAWITGNHFHKLNPTDPWPNKLKLTNSLILR